MVLQASYDTPQLEAIEVATSHMADDIDRSNSQIKVLPFTLIQVRVPSNRLDAYVAFQSVTLARPRLSEAGAVLGHQSTCAQ